VLGLTQWLAARSEFRNILRQNAGLGKLLPSNSSVKSRGLAPTVLVHLVHFVHKTMDEVD